MVGSYGLDKNNIASGRSDMNNSAKNNTDHSLVSATITLASLLGIFPVGRGLGRPGLWGEARSLASIAVSVCFLAAFVTIYLHELSDGPTMRNYTTVQRLAEGTYVLLTFCCPAAIVVISWPRCHRILQLLREMAVLGQGAVHVWGQSVVVLLLALLDALVYGRWYFDELSSVNCPLFATVVFTASYAWVQLTVVTPLLLQLLITTTLAQFFATLRKHLEGNESVSKSAGSSLYQNLQAIESSMNNSNHVNIQEYFHRDNRQSVRISKNTRHLHKPYRWKANMMAMKAMRQMVGEHQRLAELCDRLSEALGPLLIFTHLYLVYTIILAIFTVVFNYKFLLESDHILLSGITLSCALAGVVFYLGGDAADRLTHQASLHLKTLTGYSHTGDYQTAAVALIIATGQETRFSVSGLYFVSRSNLLHVTQAVTSYLVILLQFYFSELYQ